MESARFATGALTLSVLRATSDAPGATAQLPAAPFPPLRVRKPAWSRAGPLGPGWDPGQLCLSREAWPRRPACKS